MEQASELLGPSVSLSAAGASGLTAPPPLLYLNVEKREGDGG